MKLNLISFLFVFTFFANACEITVRVEDYSAQSRLLDGKWHGIDVELAKALLTNAGCSYEFVVLPWGRALKLLEKGEIDMMLSVSKTPERVPFAYFIGPERLETIVFVGPKQTTPITQIETLLALDKPIALQRGAFYGETFTKLIFTLAEPANHFVYTTDNQSKADLIKTKRISGFLEARLNVEFELENSDIFDGLMIHPVIINQAPVYYAFSKASVSEAIITKLNESYTKLNANGTFDKIFTQYNVK